MSLVEHAHRELALSGQYDEDPAFAQSIIAAVAAFASYGHSGGSAEEGIDQLTRLLRHLPLSPLTDDPDEWADRSEESGQPWWQNVRDSRAMSHDAGQTYWLVDERQAADFTSPAAGNLPEGALESAMAGAARLDAYARTPRMVNLLAHALAGLAEDGFLTAGGTVRPRPVAPTHRSRPARDRPAEPVTEPVEAAL